MKRKVINGILIVLVLAGLAALAFFVRVGVKTDAVAVLEITGMTCGSCVPTIKNALQAEKGVAAVEIDLDGGRAVVGYAAKTLKPEVLVATVARLGFTGRIAELSSLAEYKARHKDTVAGLEKAAACACCNESDSEAPPERESSHRHMMPPKKAK